MSSTVDPLCSARECVFKGIGRCQDKVADRICNGHAAMFGLIYKSIPFHSASGQTWTRTNVFVLQGHNIEIPLFMDRQGHILMRQIQSFAQNISSKYSDIKLTPLIERIASLFGVAVHAGSGNPRDDWLLRKDTQIVTYTRNSAKYYSGLPQLHSILFNNAHPSMSFSNSAGATDVSAEQMIIMIPNIIFESSPDAEFGDTFRFRLVNPSLVLAWTTKPNMLATPLVLDSVRRGHVMGPSTVTFRPLLRDCVY